MPIVHHGTQTIFYSFVLHGLLLVFNINKLHLTCSFAGIFLRKTRSPKEKMLFELSAFQEDMLPMLFVSDFLGGIET